MKYFSLIVFAAALSWTWSMTHQQHALSEEVHLNIQSDLKRIIADFIQESLPSATELHFERFWTETISPVQVKATFAYTFIDQFDVTGTTKVSLGGYAILNRDDRGGDDIQHWSLDDLKIHDHEIEFYESIPITPSFNGN